jgi:hypothetical protein
MQNTDYKPVPTVEHYYSIISNWCQAQHIKLVPDTAYQTGARHSIISNWCQTQHHIKLEPGTASYQIGARYSTAIKFARHSVISNWCQTQQCHQTGARHRITGAPGTASYQTGARQSAHLNGAKYSTVIKLPGTAVSSNWCQAQHHIKLVPNTPVTKLAITLQSAPHSLDQQYVLHSDHENR